MTRQNNDFNRPDWTLVVKRGHSVLPFLKKRFGDEELRFGAVILASPADSDEELRREMENRGYRVAYFETGGLFYAPYATGMTRRYVFVKRGREQANAGDPESAKLKRKGRVSSPAPPATRQPAHYRELIPELERVSQSVAELKSLRQKVLAERFSQNQSFLETMALFESRSTNHRIGEEDGWNSAAPESTDFAGLMNQISFKFVSPDQKRRWAKTQQALADLAWEMDRPTPATPEKAGQEFLVRAARVALALGTNGALVSPFENSAKGWILKDLFDKRARFLKGPHGPNVRTALNLLIQLGKELPTDDSSVSKGPTVQLADVEGENADNIAFLEKVAERAGETITGPDEKEMPTLTILISDKNPEDLRRRLETLQKRHSSEGVRRLLELWNSGRIWVWTRQDDGKIDVQKVLAGLPVPENRRIRIITRDLSRWRIEGLPESRRELVEFLLFLTKDLSFIATPAKMEEVLRAQQLLNIQA